MTLSAPPIVTRTPTSSPSILAPAAGASIERVGAAGGFWSGSGPGGAAPPKAALMASHWAPVTPGTASTPPPPLGKISTTPGASTDGEGSPSRIIHTPDRSTYPVPTGTTREGFPPPGSAGGSGAGRDARAIPQRERTTARRNERSNMDVLGW